MSASVSRHPDDPNRDEPIGHRQLRHLGMHCDGRHRGCAAERPRNRVPPGIARVHVRSLVGGVLMRDCLRVNVSGEPVLMLRMVVPDVRVRVQAGHLAHSGQQGDSDDQHKRTLHALSVYGTGG